MAIVGETASTETPSLGRTTFCPRRWGERRRGRREGGGKNEEEEKKKGRKFRKGEKEGGGRSGLTGRGEDGGSFLDLDA